jgi:hypothetical protein
MSFQPTLAISASRSRLLILPNLSSQRSPISQCAWRYSQSLFLKLGTNIACNSMKGLEIKPRNNQLTEIRNGA